jgi:ADP-ribose pyrophosphatase
MQPWKTLERRTVLDAGKYLRVENHVVELPDGRVIPDWMWLIAPDYVNVIAVTDEEKFICFRQMKYAITGMSLAPVGGYLEAGEEPLAAARRELMEEAGYAADEWIDLGAYRVEANRGLCTACLFLARGARCVAVPDSDDLEEMELVLLDRMEVEQALDRGEFKALAWTTAMALALRHLNGRLSIGE